MARRISLVDISSKRRRVRRLLFWGGILLVLGLLIVGILWVVVRSSLFKVRDINVTGATYVAPDDIREFLKLHVAQGGVTKFLGPENIFAWPDEFSGNELGDLSAISSLDIQKHYTSRSVDVVVTERKRVGIWCFAETDPHRCFWFDANGTLFMPSYSAEGNLTFLLEDHSRKPMALGERVLEARFLPNLISIFSALRSIHLSAREVRLNDLGREEIEVLTYDGPKLFFSLRFPVAGAPDAIAAVEKITALSKLQYIDFRVENKVYYK
jgi:cell division septal protein FtsQ